MTLLFNYKSNLVTKNVHFASPRNMKPPTTWLLHNTWPNTSPSTNHKLGPKWKHMRSSSDKLNLVLSY